MGDGHLGKCKPCTRLDVQKNRAERITQYRNYDRLRYMVNGDRATNNKEYVKKHMDKIREAKGKWASRNPEKRRAHLVVAKELIAGRLKREPCRVCGKAAHAHHHDYSKPLKVEWLCPLHHSDQHRKERGQKDYMLSSMVGS